MIVFDVGANNGTDSRSWLDRGATVYAFDPAPAMVAALHAIPGLIVVPAAVADYNGRAQFHLAEEADQGCSSLLKFNEAAVQFWPGRDDLTVTRVVRVPVIRLDTYMRRHAIESVDYLHIDAQGADLAVLRGLGDRYVDVKAGRVEAATRRDSALYRDQPLEGDLRAWLTDHGFTVTARTPNDKWENEVNLEFRR